MKSNRKIGDLWSAAEKLQLLGGDQPPALKIRRKFIIGPWPLTTISSNPFYCQLEFGQVHFFSFLPFSFLIQFHFLFVFVFFFFTFVFINILLQALEEFVEGKIPCTSPEATLYCVLALQTLHGDFDARRKIVTKYDY